MNCNLASTRTSGFTIMSIHGFQTIATPLDLVFLFPFTPSKHGATSDLKPSHCSAFCHSAISSSVLSFTSCTHQKSASPKHLSNRLIEPAPVMFAVPTLIPTLFASFRWPSFFAQASFPLFVLPFLQSSVRPPVGTCCLPPSTSSSFCPRSHHFPSCFLLLFQGWATTP